MAEPTPLEEKLAPKRLRLGREEDQPPSIPSELLIPKTIPGPIGSQSIGQIPNPLHPEPLITGGVRGRGIPKISPRAVGGGWHAPDDNLEALTEAGIQNFTASVRQAESNLPEMYKDMEVFWYTEAQRESLNLSIDDHNLREYMFNFRSTMADRQFSSFVFTSGAADFPVQSVPTNDDLLAQDETFLAGVEATNAQRVKVARANFMWQTLITMQTGWVNGEYDDIEDAINTLIGTGEDAEYIRSLISPELLEQLDSAFSSLAANVPRTFSVVDIGDKDIDDVLEDLTKPAESQVIFISNYSAKQLADMMQTRGIPELELPRGMSISDFTRYLGTQGVDKETIDGLNSSREDLTELVGLFQEQRLMSTAIQADLASAIVPALSWKEAMKLSILQPAYQAATMMEWYANSISEPSAALQVRSGLSPVTFATQGYTVGSAFGKYGRVIGAAAGFTYGMYSQFKYRGELQSAYLHARSRGDNFWEANGQAFQDWDAGFGSKILLETAGDPLLFFGFEMYGRQIAKIGSSSRAGLINPATGLVRTRDSNIAWLSSRLLATERRVNQVTDAAFILPFKAIGKIPLTPSQVAIRRAIAVANRGRKLVKKVSVTGLPDGSLPPGPLVKWFSPTIDRDTTRAVAEYSWQAMVDAKKSNVAMDDYALFGDMLRESVNRWLDAEEISRLFTPMLRKSTEGRSNIRYVPARDPQTKIGQVLTVLDENTVEITIENVTKINEILQSTIHKSGTRYSILEARAEIARILQAGNTAGEREAGRIIGRYARNIKRDALAPFRSLENPDDMFKRVFQETRDTFNRNINSDAWRYYEDLGVNQSRTTREIAKYGQRAPLTWAMWLDQAIVYPFSRAVLYFLNYGPFNVLESKIRLIMAGHPMRPPPHIRAEPAYALWLQQGDLTNSSDFLFDLDSTFHTMRQGPIAAPLSVEESHLGIPIADNVRRGIFPGITEDLDHFAAKFPIFGDKIAPKVGELPRGLMSLASLNDVSSRIATHDMIRYDYYEFARQLDILGPKMNRQLRGAIAGDVAAGFGHVDWEILEQRVGKDLTDIVKGHITGVGQRGPDMVEAIEGPIAALLDLKLSHNIDKALNEHPWMDEPFKNSIMELVRNGKLHSGNLDEMMPQFAAMLLESNHIYQAWWADQITDELVRQIKTFTPTDVKSAMAMLGQVDLILETVRTKMSNVSQAAAVRGHQIKSSTVRSGLHSNSKDVIEKMSNSLEAAIIDLREDIVAKLRVGVPGITPSRANLMLRRLDFVEQDMRNLIAADGPRVMEARRHELVFIRRTESLESANLKVEQAWNDYWAQHYRIKADMSDIDDALFLEEGGIKPEKGIREPISTELTSSDIAFMYAGRDTISSDMVSNILDKQSLTLKTKEEFIAEHMATAERQAEKRKAKAEDFGFNQGSVGKVYDDLLSSLSFQPGSGYHEPLMQAVEGVRNSLYDSLWKSKVTPEDHEIYSRVIRQVANNIRRTDITDGYWEPKITRIPNKDMDPQWDNPITSPDDIPPGFVHGTSEGNIKNILRDGLTPGSSLEPSGQDVYSTSDVIRIHYSGEVTGPDASRSFAPEFKIRSNNTTLQPSQISAIEINAQDIAVPGTDEGVRSAEEVIQDSGDFAESLGFPRDTPEVIFDQGSPSEMRRLERILDSQETAPGSGVRADGQAVAIGPEGVEAQVIKDIEASGLNIAIFRNTFDEDGISTGMELIKPGRRTQVSGTRALSDEGRPVIVYHGTYRNFEEFLPDSSSNFNFMGAGIYVAENPAVAGKYVGDMSHKWTARGNLISESPADSQVIADDLNIDLTKVADAIEHSRTAPGAPEKIRLSRSEVEDLYWVTGKSDIRQDTSVPVDLPFMTHQADVLPGERSITTLEKYLRRIDWNSVPESEDIPDEVANISIRDVHFEQDVPHGPIHVEVDFDQTVDARPQVKTARLNVQNPYKADHAIGSSEVRAVNADPVQTGVTFEASSALDEGAISTEMNMDEVFDDFKSIGLKSEFHTSRYDTKPIPETSEFGGLQLFVGEEAIEGGIEAQSRANAEVWAEILNEGADLTPGPVFITQQDVTSNSIQRVVKATPKMKHEVEAVRLHNESFTKETSAVQVPAFELDMDVRYHGRTYNLRGTMQTGPSYEGEDWSSGGALLIELHTKGQESAGVIGLVTGLPPADTGIVQALTDNDLVRIGRKAMDESPEDVKSIGFIGRSVGDLDVGMAEAGAPLVGTREFFERGRNKEEWVLEVDYEQIRGIGQPISNADGSTTRVENFDYISESEEFADGLKKEAFIPVYNVKKTFLDPVKSAESRLQHNQFMAGYDEWTSKLDFSHLDDTTRSAREQDIRSMRIELEKVYEDPNYKDFHPETDQVKSVRNINVYPNLRVLSHLIDRSWTYNLGGPSTGQSVGNVLKEILQSGDFDSIRHYGGPYGGTLKSRTGGDAEGRVWILWDGNQIQLPQDSVDKILMRRDIPNPEWTDIRERAALAAKERRTLDYPTYNNDTALNASAQSIFPYFNYEAQRWPWIMRNMLSRPGPLQAWGRYTRDSDGGYTHIPGTNLEINPLRGTVWMGGLRRLYKADYPEYADQFGFGTEFLDYISRLGFWPGIHVQLPITMFGAASTSHRPQLGEVLPPTAQTALGAITAKFPDAGFTAALNNIIFPDRFRDFKIANLLSETEFGGHDGVQIWQKRKDGIALTATEQSAWNKTARHVAIISAGLDSQFGLFRVRGREKIEALEALRQAYFVYTGISPEQQIEISSTFAATGRRLNDVVALDPMDRFVVREFLEKHMNHLQQQTAPLMPSLLGDIQSKTIEYHNQIEDIFEGARRNGFVDTDAISGAEYQSHRPIEAIELDWRAGVITSRDAISEINDVLSFAIDSVKGIGDLPRFEGVPKTRFEREQFYMEHNIPMPTWSAGQEILWEYYNLEPRLKFNPDTGTMERDFDGYFAHIDMMFELMGPEFGPRLLSRIQADWADMQVLRGGDSREFIRPYKNIRAIVQRRQPENEQAIIERFLRSEAAERQNIREELRPDGRGVIANWEAEVSQTRENLRLLNPELDSVLLFWGEVSGVLTQEAQDMYNDRVRRERPGVQTLEATLLQ